MIAHAPIHTFCLAQLILVTFVFLACPAAGEKYRRLCRYDVRTKQCVDIGARRCHAHRRKNVTPKHGAVKTTSVFNNRNFNALDINNISDSSIKTVLKDVNVPSTKGPLPHVPVGKCNAQDGVCDIREVHMKMKCRCWASSDDLVSAGERLCRMVSDVCIDVSLSGNIERRGRKRKQTRNCRTKKVREGRERKGKKIGINSRRQKYRHKHSRWHKASITSQAMTRMVKTRSSRCGVERIGRCATLKGGVCRNIDNTGRRTDRKCECI